MVKTVFTARIIGGGRITIPVEVRYALSIKKGDVVEIGIELLKPKTEVIMRGKGEEDA